MGNSAVKAQQLANEANISIADSTNLANREIAAAQNELNYKMFNEQNTWNLKQWERENDYNSPSQQMQRYLEAGINPLWAMSNGDAGQARQLTSASPSPAVGATMVAPQVAPEYDPNRISNIIGAANNVSNSLQGFLKLGLEAEDVDTRRQSQKSQEALNRAEAYFKRSQTEGQDLMNKLNQDTYSSLVLSRVREADLLANNIDNAKKTGIQIDAQIDNLRETKNQIIASTDLMKAQKDRELASIQQGWRKLAIDAYNAQTASFSAYSQNYWQGQNYQLNSRKQAFEESKFAEELRSKSTSDLIKMVEFERGLLDKLLPGLTSAIKSGFTGEESSLDKIYQSFDRLNYVGDILRDRIESNPLSHDDIKAFDTWQKAIGTLPSAPEIPLINSNAQGFSVLNPTSDWLK